MNAYREGCPGCEDLQKQVRSSEQFCLEYRGLVDQYKGEKRALEGRVLRLGVLRALLVGLGVAGGVLGFGAVVGTFRGWASQPSAPELCRESAEIISLSTTSRTCPPGAAISREPLGEDKLVVTCRCAGAASSPAGGPSAGQVPQ